MSLKGRWGLGILEPVGKISPIFGARFPRTVATRSDDGRFLRGGGHPAHTKLLEDFFHGNKQLFISKRLHQIFFGARFYRFYRAFHAGVTGYDHYLHVIEIFANVPYEVNTAQTGHFKVVLSTQLCKFPVEGQIRTYLPYFRCPPVHLHLQ